jgi:HAD superfamily hydrolase (TIGR01459 family)
LIASAIGFTPSPMTQHTSNGGLSAPAIPILSSIAPLFHNRKALLVDIWGVMHNGAAPFTGAASACQTFRKGGGVVLLLSNAPRPAPSVADQLRRIGVSAEAYDGILTSGDACRDMIAALGARPVYHLGPDRDRTLFEDTFAGQLVDANKADAIVCTGLFDDETETPEDYRDRLLALADRSVEMICANPDVQVERNGKLIYCAGAVANLYAQLGGDVRFAGKPYAPIYQLAKRRLSDLAGKAISNPDMLAIGDGVHTDILGAGQAGIDAVFIASAVHVRSQSLTPEDLASVFNAAPHPPIAAMQTLAW